jgi:hypothetical protein
VTLSLPWDRAGWRESVAVWIDESLAMLRVEATAPVEHVRQRPWAAIALIPTADGPLYFKADPPSESFEPALTQWLAQRRPDVIPDVLRIDGERGWLLTRDAGTPLREHMANPPDPTIWDDLLPLYAELQIELCTSVDDLLSLGVPDKRTEKLAPGYGALLSRWAVAATAPSQEEIDELVDGVGETIPPSLAHEEFQDHNILLREAIRFSSTGPRPRSSTPSADWSTPSAAWSIAGGSSRARTSSSASGTRIWSPGRNSHPCPS